MTGRETHPIYVSMAELVSRYDRLGDTPNDAAEPLPLTRYELRVFSPNGEDGVIAEILCRIGADRPHFAEVGAGEGREGSCVALADLLGWPGAFIEADPALHSGLAAKYAGARRVRTLAAEVGSENVETLLTHLGVPAEPAVISIDADGAEYWIWQALRSFTAGLVVVRYNAALGPTSQLVQPIDSPRRWDGTDYFGASIAALRDLATAKGYDLVHTDLTGTNAFFVRSDLAQGRFAPADQVPLRGPNYGFAMSLPRDPHARAYVDPSRERDDMGDPR